MQEAIEYEDDGQRSQWTSSKWTGRYNRALAEELEHHQLLLHDAQGPYANRPKRVCDTFVLRAEPGCRQQPTHADVSCEQMAYGERSTRRTSLGSHKDCPLLCGDVPGSTLLAIDDDTTLQIFPNGCRDGPGIQLRLCKGDLVYWRGDLVHAGSAYSTLNLRVHSYVDSKAWKRPSDSTSPCTQLGAGFVVACELREEMVAAAG